MKKEWGDFAPTTKELPMDVITHFAKVCDLPMSQKLVWFAQSIWTECNMDKTLEQENAK
jgi:hypothetical protein